MQYPHHFGNRLSAAVEAKKSAVCVGLDPRWHLLPDGIQSGVDGANRQSVAAATLCYCREVIDAVVDAAPIIKPQAAFFEQLGPPGMAALGEVINYARQLGLLVLLDGKRGDIGSTAEGYADAYLGNDSAWKCDALTVNPFLGDDTLVPFIQTANDRGAGIFVLVKTSNPGSGYIQDQPCDGGTIYEKIAAAVQSAAVASLEAHASDGQSYGNVGAVVGATYPQQLAALRSLMPNAWLLIPGFGSQGGTAADVAHGFDDRGRGAIVNSSRGIIFAYSQAKYAACNWQDAIARAAVDMRDELNAVA